MANDEEAPADLIPVKLAAKQHGVSYNTMRTWLSRGEVATWKIVGRNYVSASELRRYLRAHRVYPRAPGGPVGPVAPDETSIADQVS